MPKFEIYAALNDEANEGWVWQQKFQRRAIVTISRTLNHRTHKIFCVTRKFDPNFLTRYNQGACKRGQTHTRGQRYEIDAPDRALVMGEWYRQLLHIGPATAHRPGIELAIDEATGWLTLAGIRAACQQPDLAIRVGTRLGVLGG